MWGLPASLHRAKKWGDPLQTIFCSAFLCPMQKNIFSHHVQDFSCMRMRKDSSLTHATRFASVVDFSPPSKNRARSWHLFGTYWVQLHHARFSAAHLRGSWWVGQKGRQQTEHVSPTKDIKWNPYESQRKGRPKDMLGYGLVCRNTD